MGAQGPNGFGRDLPGFDPDDFRSEFANHPGTLDKTGAYSGPVPYNDPGVFQVGMRGGPPRFANTGGSEIWGGLMQHIAVYERIMTQTEILSHWAEGIGQTTGGASS